MISSPITNLYISKYLTDLNVKHFRGVFSANNINQDLIRENEFIIICNLDKEKEIGSHFITIVYINKTIFFLDSLGLNFTKYNYIFNFLKKLSAKKLYALKKPIQSILSEGCGFYCIYFCLLFNVLIKCNKHYIKQIKNFNEDKLELNDNILLHNISVIKKMYPIKSCNI